MDGDNQNLIQIEPLVKFIYSNLDENEGKTSKTELERKAIGII